MKISCKPWRWLLIFILSIWIVSCSQIDEGTLVHHPGLRQKALNFPNSIRPLNHEEKITSCIDKSGINVLIVLKGGCESCLIELNRWQLFFEQEDVLRKSSIVVIIIESMNYILEYEILEKEKFSFPIFHDETGEFIVTNNLQILVYDRVAVLNTENQIIYLGSPFIYPELMNGFLELLSQ